MNSRRRRRQRLPNKPARRVVGCTIVATLVPDPGASRIDFTIPVDCAGGEDGGTAQSLIAVSIILNDADGGTDGGSEVLEVRTKVVSIR